MAHRLSRDQLQDRINYVRNTIAEQEAALMAAELADRRREAQICRHELAILYRQRQILQRRHGKSLWPF